MNRWLGEYTGRKTDKQVGSFLPPSFHTCISKPGAVNISYFREEVTLLLPRIGSSLVLLIPLPPISSQMCSNIYHFSIESLISLHQMFTYKHLQFSYMLIDTHIFPQPGSPQAKVHFVFHISVSAQSSSSHASCHCNLSPTLHSTIPQRSQSPFPIPNFMASSPFNI